MTDVRFLGVVCLAAGSGVLTGGEVAGAVAGLCAAVGWLLGRWEAR